MRAKDLRVGQSIILDFGYGPHTNDKPAQIRKISFSDSLFDETKQICFHVETRCGERMVSSFDPDDKVTLA